MSTSVAERTDVPKVDRRFTPTEIRRPDNPPAVVAALCEQCHGVAHRLARIFYRSLSPAERHHLGGLDAFVSEALRGLWGFARRYEPGRGLQPSTLAWRAVRNQLLAFIEAGRCRKRVRVRPAFWLGTAAGDARVRRRGIDEHRRRTRRGAELDDVRERYGPVRAAMRAVLTLRERRILRLRFRRGLTLDGTGAVVGVCKERVRQVQDVALAKLRAALGAA